MPKMKLADRYANACYKYLRNYGRIVYYTYKYDKKPQWSIDGLLHDMEQCLTEIQGIYNGKIPTKWGCKDIESLIEETNRCARKLYDVAQKYRDEHGDTY